MARAILPTGQAIEFPDETPDHEIHAAVRAQMGLPPPHQIDGPAAIEAMSAMQQGFAELSHHLSTAVQLLQETAQSMAGAVQNTAQSMATAVQQFERATQAIAHTVDAGAQRVAQSVAIGTDKMMHVSGQAAGHAATSANVIHDAAKRIEAIGPRIEGSVATVAQKVDNSIDNLVKEIRRPKKAVKAKDGSWHTENVGT